MFGVALLLANIILVRIYGELEFTFAMLKIMLIFGVNIMALVIACGGGPDGHAYGFQVSRCLLEMKCCLTLPKQYWRNPGPFVQYLGVSGPTGRFIGFWTVFSNAVYAYAGVENVSLAAAETRSPRRNIPIAV